MNRLDSDDAMFEHKFDGNDDHTPIGHGTHFSKARDRRSIIKRLMLRLFLLFTMITTAAGLSCEDVPEGGHLVIPDTVTYIQMVRSLVVPP